MKARQSQVAQLLWQQLHADQPVFFLFFFAEYCAVIFDERAHTHLQISFIYTQSLINWPQLWKKNSSYNNIIIISPHGLDGSGSLLEAAASKVCQWDRGRRHGGEQMMPGGRMAQWRLPQWESSDGVEHEEAGRQSERVSVERLT